MAPEQNVLDAGLGCGGDGDRIAVATQAGGDPEDVDFFYGGRTLGGSAIRRCLRAIVPLLSDSV